MHLDSSSKRGSRRGPLFGTEAPFYAAPFFWLIFHPSNVLLFRLILVMGLVYGNRHHEVMHEIMLIKGTLGLWWEMRSWKKHKRAFESGQIKRLSRNFLFCHFNSLSSSLSFRCQTPRFGVWHENHMVYSVRNGPTFMCVWACIWCVCNVGILICHWISFTVVTWNLLWCTMVHT